MNTKFKNKKLIFISFFIASILVFSFTNRIFYSPAIAAGPSEAGGAAVITCLEMDPRDSRIIYAGSRDGLFKTRNSGVNWESTELKHLIVWGVEAFGNIVYVASNQGVYKSTDGGESWNLMPEKIGKLSLLTFSLANPDIVYASNRETIFKSTNGAGTWRTFERDLPSEVFQVSELEANPENPQVVHAKVVLARQTGEFTHEIIGEAIVKTIDGGENWSQLEIEEFEFERSDLIIDPHNPSILYKATFIGVAKSKDGGKTWENTGWIIRSATSLIVDPSDPDTIYVGTEGNGVWRSVDGGVYWDEAGLEGAIVYSLEAVFEERGGLVLAVAATNHGALKAHKSIRPETWDSISDYSSYLIIDSHNLDVFYAGSGGNGVLKSMDAGETWTPINNGISKPLATFSWVKYLAIDPHNSDVVYMINNENGGIYKSTNAGESWQKISTGLGEAYASSLVVAPDNSNELYLGIWEVKGGKIVGVYKSIDGGETWEDPSLKNMKIRTLKIDPSTTPYTIYAGTYGQGVYKSTDKGITWVVLDEELISKEISVNAIAISPLPVTSTFHPLDIFIKSVFAASQGKSLVYLATNEGVRRYEVTAEEISEEKFLEKVEFIPLQYSVMISVSIAILGLIGWWIYRTRKRKIT